MEKINKKAIILLIIVGITSCLFANTAIKSYEEEYYDFLTLIGRAKRSYLTYRTMSLNDYYDIDGFWDIDDSKKEVGKGELEIYGPSLFVSENTYSPYGQNDGGLWQGKGLNASLKAGVNYSIAGLSFTFKPEFNFSQNLEYSTVNNTNKYFWGGLDKVQRYDETPYYTLDLTNLGDSEIRYTLGFFTVGFGTEYLWLGPTYLNAILHSNNAPSYPRFDIGMVPTETFLGEIEGHYNLGILSRTDDKEDEWLHLLTAAWRPWFLKSFTFGANLACETWATEDALKDLVTAGPFQLVNADEDFKLSVTADMLLPESGFEFYTELAWDDYPWDFIMSCYHTFVHQIGVKKSIDIAPQKDIYGEVIVEVGNMEMSSDAFTQWSYNFYTHGGAGAKSYTNAGQNLGAGSGYAGNSEYIGFTLFYPVGYTTLYGHRSNPDLNYILNYVNNNGKGNVTVDEHPYFYASRGELEVGVNTVYIGLGDLRLSGGLAYQIIYNENYTPGIDKDSAYTHNFHAELGVEYKF